MEKKVERGQPGRGWGGLGWKVGLSVDAGGGGGGMCESGVWRGVRFRLLGEPGVISVAMRRA